MNALPRGENGLSALLWGKLFHNRWKTHPQNGGKVDGYAAFPHFPPSFQHLESGKPFTECINNDASTNQKNLCTFGALVAGVVVKWRREATKTAKKDDKAARGVLYCNLYSQHQMQAE